MDNLLHFVQTVNSYLSDYILVILLIGVGLWYSIKTNFVQVRCFGEGMQKVFGNLKLNGEKHESGMSSFQAARHGYRRPGRHGQHRGRLRRDTHRRPRRDILDVGNRLLRHGDDLRGSRAGTEDPHQGRGRPRYTAAPSTTSPRPSRAASASSSLASSPWPSYLRWASSAAWCSPTPSAPPAPPPSAYPPGSWAPCWWLICGCHLPGRRAAPCLRHREDRAHHGGHLPA